MLNRVIRSKNADYAVISNVFLRDARLSLKCKGFMSLVMGLPEDWDFSVNGIMSVVKEGQTAVYSAINELRRRGYCRVVVNRDGLGRITGRDYIFSEVSMFVENADKSPHMENPDMDNPDVEKCEIVENDNKNNNYNSLFECVNSIDDTTTKDTTIDDTSKNEEKKKKKSIRKEKEIFAEFVEKFRRLTGRKTRGIQTEFDDFTSRHRDWRSVLPYLSLAIEREHRDRIQAANDGRFFPEPKMLQTWLGKQRAWEMYVTVGEDLSATSHEYVPTGRGFTFNKSKGIYTHTGNFFAGDLLDGYDACDRPDGALVELNNARGLWRWDASRRVWEKQ